MNSTKIKSGLHFVVSIGANLIMLEVIPAQYKVYAILGFNLAQVLYAFYDPTYAFQKFGGTKK